ARPPRWFPDVHEHERRGRVAREPGGDAQRLSRAGREVDRTEDLGKPHAGAMSMRRAARGIAASTLRARNRAIAAAPAVEPASAAMPRSAVPREEPRAASASARWAVDHRLHHMVV